MTYGIYKVKILLRKILKKYKEKTITLLFT